MADVKVNLNGDEFSPEEIEAARVTAFALGQLSEEESAATQVKLTNDADGLNQVEAVRALSVVVRQCRNTEARGQLSDELRNVIEHRLGNEMVNRVSADKEPVSKNRKPWRRPTIGEALVVGGLAAILVALFLPASQTARNGARQAQTSNKISRMERRLGDHHDTFSATPGSVATNDWSQGIAGGYGNLPVEFEYRSAEQPPMMGGGWVDSGQSVGFPIRVRRGGAGGEGYFEYFESPGTEQYVPIQENRFLSPREAPLSTFSIDVDTAAYANVRRFINSGRLPPADSVRIEELVNYFRYAYPQPREGRPFSVNMEVAECPWRSGHWLLKVGLKGKEVPRSERPASNLVFLLDVSGSMADENKLPLLKTAMKMLAGELGEDDKVSIVTYAGEAGLKLLPTRGNEQRKISRVIEGLSAGGSTNGSAGIELAYEQAAAGFIEGGTNRVILCTDGDLNVGVTSDEALTKLIKQKAKSGVLLTVLGFGEGNLKDGKMERLADNGNGLYAYIDSVREARKVLVEQLAGSTITIAKDVKIQIEFNPGQIAAYRLLGYENRVLAAKDFNNDKKDAGEIGAGHAVTALYEIVPVGADGEDAPAAPGVDPLKYQGPGARSREPQSVGNALRGVPGTREDSGTNETSGELLTLKLRYKEPDGDTSKLLEYALKERAVSFRSASEDFQFAASVASFGMVLRGSQYRADSNLAFVEEIAASSLGKDEGGYRAEFLDLVRKARGLGAK